MKTESAGLPWGKLMMGLLLLVAALIVFKALSSPKPTPVSSAAARVAAGGGRGQLAQLASSVQTGDVVVYSAVWCGTCTQAKAWMRDNGFKYTECDVEGNADCASGFRRQISHGESSLERIQRDQLGKLQSGAVLDIADRCLLAIAEVDFLDP